MTGWRAVIAFGPPVALYVWMLRDCAIRKCTLCRGRVGLLTVALLWLSIYVAVRHVESWSVEKAKTYERAKIERRP